MSRTVLDASNMQNMKQNKGLIVGVVTVIIIVLLVVFADKIKAKTGNTQENFVVYVTTGEIYVGKLSVFPKFTLTDGYLYQVAKDATDPNKNNFQLQPLKDALWGPSYIHFERENVVFYGPLSEESAIAKTLKEQKK